MMGAFTGYWTVWKAAYDGMLNHTDPRMKDYVFISDPLSPAFVMISYLLFIYVGPIWMKNRKPFVLNELLIVYNFGLVILSAYTFYEFLMAGWLFDYTFGCQLVDYSYNPKALRMARASWMFYIAKFIELLDTVFFILRKKDRQVTVLHVVHHGSLPMLWWWGVKIVPGGFGTFHALVNSFVHVVMYFYYGLAALGPRFQKYLWWKKYVTVLQLAQFFLITIHNSQFLFMTCEYPWKYVAILQIFTTLIALLFVNFYIQTYKKNKKAIKEEPKMNGTSSKMNGTNCTTQRLAKSEKTTNDHVMSKNVQNGTFSRRHVLTS